MSRSRSRRRSSARAAIDSARAPSSTLRATISPRRPSSPMPTASPGRSTQPQRSSDGTSARWGCLTLSMRLRWLALASTLGCTPSRPPAALELDDVELRPKPAMASEEPRPTIETRCGVLAIAALGEWQSQDPLLEQLQHAWDPRGAQGEPIALRRASAPAELAGHTFVQLSVLGGSRDVV